MAKEYQNIETQLIRSGEIKPRVSGAVSMPVFQSSTFEYAGEEGYDSVRYIRLNNTPNHIVLNKKLAEIENAEAAMVTSSGMAAITTALLTFLGRGDHLLAQNSLYGGTFDFITKDIGKYGIEFDLIDGNKPGEWENKLKPNTMAVYVESITNPLMQVCDLKAVTDFAKRHKLISLIDNTFTSPVNFRPAEIGFDIILHSCTKYINGHNDLVAGAAIGRSDLIGQFSHKLGLLGGTLDPHTCFLLHRGLKTLALRVRSQNQNAMKVAEFLESHPKIKYVNYPGLKSSSSNKIAAELFSGYGGMISFEIKGTPDTAEKFIKQLTIADYAPSLGGVETLIILPSKTSHAGLTPGERQTLGISDGLIRLSVGIENPEDVIKDFDTSLSKL